MRHRTKRRFGRAKGKGRGRRIRTYRMQRGGGRL